MSNPFRSILGRPSATFGLLLLLFVALPASAQDPALFPRPASLEPAIRFWTRIYTEVNADSGFLHDAVNLGIIYKVVSDDRTEIEQQRTRIQEDLRVLATGKRTGLTGHQQQILEVFPAGVENSVLAEAANNVRFQLGQADRFMAGLIRSGAYREHIERVAAERNLPRELAALPHVESSFHPGAYSHAAAAGMWQFMRTTGQRFMRIDHIIDERMDPYTSTHAAMSLLEYNHRILGSWPLALTAYNHGAGGLARAVREVGTDDIAVIIARYKGRNFGFASRNFYPQFLAVLDVEKQAQAVFGVLQLDSHPEYEEFQIDGYIEASQLASALGVTIEQLKFDNPAIRPIVWEGGKRIPRGYRVKIQRASLKGNLDNLLASISPQQLYDVQTPDVSYVVQSGDSLSGIAGRFNTSVAQLMSLNQIRDAHRIRVGQNLLLPHDKAAVAAPIIASAETPTPEPGTVQVRPASYNVRRGDTVSTIARRFGITEADLLKANGIEDPHLIFPGQTLALQVEGSEAVDPEVFDGPIEADATTPAAEAGEMIASAEQVNEDLASDPSDYSVQADGTIEIQATETLGHYAEWLGVSSSQIRRWNDMSARQPIVMGRRLRLDFTGTSKEQFELQRRQYHVAQQQEFFRNYRIQELDQYTIAANDNISTLARTKYSVPMWLLRQYNPELDFSSLQIGQTVVFPVVARVADPRSS